MTEAEFAAKVEWEGGVMDALDYGLRAKDVELGGLHTMWRDLETLWEPMRWLVGQIEDVLEDIESEER